MIDLYIYYHVREANAAQLQVRVQAMQARLGALHAVSTQLKRRPEAQGGVQTWMEIYAATADDFAANLTAAALSAGLSTLIEGERHTEAFMDLQPCA